MALSQRRVFQPVTNNEGKARHFSFLEESVSIEALALI